MSGPVTIEPIAGIGEIAEGDDVGALIAHGAALADGDIVVVAQKVVSKAEGMRRSLDDVEPSDRAIELAARLDKDPALVELILGESSRVIRDERVLIVETHSGLVCANAGIDSSNVGPGGGVLLLPRDPDASARRIRAQIRETSGTGPAVIVADSFGRPWRVGQADVAIGCAGLDPLADPRGTPDRDGRPLEGTVPAVADELASAADLVRGKAEGIPAVRITGLAHLVTADDGPGAAALRRADSEDLFR